MCRKKRWSRDGDARNEAVAHTSPKWNNKPHHLNTPPQWTHGIILKKPKICRAQYRRNAWSNKYVHPSTRSSPTIWRNQQRLWATKNWACSAVPPCSRGLTNQDNMDQGNMQGKLLVVATNKFKEWEQEFHWVWGNAEMTHAQPATGSLAQQDPPSGTVFCPTNPRCERKILDMDCLCRVNCLTHNCCFDHLLPPWHHQGCPLAQKILHHLQSWNNAGYFRDTFYQQTKLGIDFLCHANCLTQMFCSDWNTPQHLQGWNHPDAQQD